MPSLYTPLYIICVFLFIDRILFIFHKNNNAHTKAKVKPPRLNGKKVGLFSTRSPYRPNNIGLSLAKLESVSGRSVLQIRGIKDNLGIISHISP